MTLFHIKSHSLTSKIKMEIKNADELRENQHTEVPALEKEKEQHGILANTAAFGQERELNLWQSLRVFPKASILCFCAMLGALSDGYQYTLPGNVISLKGFITQFGYPNAAGTYALNPKDVSLWGGEACFQAGLPNTR